MTDMPITDEEGRRLHAQMMANLAAQGPVPAWIDEAEAYLARNASEEIAAEIADITRWLVGTFRAGGWRTSPAYLVGAVASELRTTADRLEAIVEVDNDR